MQIDVSGGGQSIGIHRNTQFGSSSVTNLISGSTVKASSRGILFQPVSPIFTATCAGVYDESFTFYTSTCP